MKNQLDGSDPKVRAARARSQAWHDKRRARGICATCPNPRPPDFTTCETCRAERRARQ